MKLSEFPPEYEILAELGRGTTGVVYKARDLRLSRIIAVKTPLILSEATRTIQFQRFIRESKAMAAIVDANVAKLHFVAEHQGRPFFGREFVEGLDLKQCAADRLIKFDDGIRVLQTISNTVDAIHQNGIVHRTLDASNILIAKEGTPKLIGFGRVGLVEEATNALPGKKGASVRDDVSALQQMITWLCSALRQTIPDSLEPIRQVGAVKSASEFAAALGGYLDDQTSQ